MNSPSDASLEPPSLEDIVHVSELAVALVGKGPESGFIAFALMVQNRCMAAQAYMRAFGQRHPEYGAGTWSEACGSIPKPSNEFCLPLSREHLRAMSSVCRVAAGEVDDLTRGATRCSRHDEEPSWATQATATALIGDLVFFC